MKSTTKFWWKIYAWLGAALTIGVVIAALATDVVILEPSLLQSPWDFALSGTQLISLIGIFGFAYSRSIFSKHLWQLWLPLILLRDVVLYVYVYDFGDGSSGSGWLFLTFVTLFAVLFALPEYLAIYYYGYRSDPLWESTAAFSSAN